ncbi:MAG: outer membrane beta-barrel protein [Bacteroidia bacterium]|nr:outer membrane beta-barrel protein [Bacteroidia bacterium]MDW8236439.1 outer membrane beta-barrel protein [Bacteroidia bacterium]
MQTKTLISLLFLFALSWAQKNTLHFGVLFQPQTHWLLNSMDSDAGPILDYQSTWGYAGGLRLAYRFSDYVGVGIDAIYSSEGQKYKGKDEALGVVWNSRTRLTYLKLPLLLHFGSDPESPVQFSFFFGPQLGLLMGYKDQFESTITRTNFTTKVEASGKEGIMFDNPALPRKKTLNTEPYQKQTYAGVVGLGVAFRLTEGVLLSVHFRGDYTFNDVENKEASYQDAPNVNHEFWHQNPRYRHYHGNEERPATAALTGGVLVGLTYYVPLK